MCICRDGHIGVGWCLSLGGGAIGEIGISVWRQKDLSVSISFFGGKLTQPGVIREQCCCVVRELCTVWPWGKNSS